MPRAENFEPFAPHGYWAVGGVASLLFFCFAGWEAVTHLAGEFRNPERDLKRATWLTLVVVGVVYIGVVAASVAVLGPALPGSDVPIAQLLEKGLGGLAAPLTAVAAAVLTFGPINTFVAGASRLGASLASDGVLPRALARGAGPGQVPAASLGLLAVMTFLSFGAAAAGLSNMQFQIAAASACFTAVTAFGLLAGIRLLPARTPAWYGVIVAAVVMLAVLLFSGWALAVPLGLAAAAVWVGRPAGRRATAVRLPRGTPTTAAAVGGGPAGGGAVCCAASCPALTVASIIEVMNRVAISSSSGVNSAIAAAMWRASGMEHGAAVAVGLGGHPELDLAAVRALPFADHVPGVVQPVDQRRRGG